MEDEIILPDDYTEPEVDQIEEPIEPTEPVEDTKPTEPVEQPKPTVKLKYNHEEKEYSLDDVVPLAQKGLNYDKTVERLKQLETDPRFAFVEAQARKYNMSPTEYIEAVKQQEEQAQLQELIQKNIPEEYAKEMLENRKFREQTKAEKEAQAKQQQQNKEYEEFLNAYPDVKAEDIPPEVWIYQANTGKSLTDAMMWHENQQLKSKLKALEHNADVAKKTPVGSVAKHGTTDPIKTDDFLSGFDEE